MKKIILFTLILLGYNLAVLTLPLIIFLASLSLSQEAFIYRFYWFFCPFLLLSPILTVILCFRVALAKKAYGINWVTPLLIAMISFFPFWLLFLSLTSLWSIRDYIFVCLIPILLGFLANGFAKIWEYKKSLCNRL